MDEETQQQLEQDLAEQAAAEEPSLLDKATEAFTQSLPGVSADKTARAPIIDWAAKLPRNITVGLLDAAISAGDQVERVDEAADSANPVASGISPTNNIPAVKISNAIYEKVKPNILAFRNYVAGQEQSGDEITQAISQYAIPFMGYAKAIGGLKGASALGTIGRAAAVETMTASTVLQPHDTRFADILALGKHTEGRFADAMNTIAPDGSLFNAYIDYMTNRENESDAEGTFKNVVDNLGVSAVAAGMLTTAAKTLKAGNVVLKTIGENAGTGGKAIGPSKQKGMISPFTNNASGESSASAEAIRRAVQEKVAGQTRALIDRDGTVHTLSGVDAVDLRAREGQVIVQRGIGVDEWTPLDRGEGVKNATSRINAAREQLDKLGK